MEVSKQKGLVFLAYANEDKHLVRLLFKKLQQAGLNPWLDEESIPLGSMWEKEIEKAIHCCGIFLACISKNSVAKDGYVQKELAIALSQAEKKANLHQRLIPVILDNSEIPNITVGSINIAHFQGVNISTEDGMSRLVSGIKSLIPTEQEAVKEIRDFDKLRGSLSLGEIDRVLDQLVSLIHPEDTRKRNTIIMLKAEYADLDDQKFNGVISPESAKIEKAKIRNAVLRLLDKIELSFNN